MATLTLHERVKLAESGGNPDAVSPAGAVGSMQTLPSTLKDPGFGVKPAASDTAAERERVGNDYLNAMLKRYDGNERLALIAYNWGPDHADDIATGARKPDALPSETRNYLSKILGDTTTAAPKGKAPAARAEGQDLSTKYNTPIAPIQRKAYNEWLSTLAPKQRSLYDYDLQGAFLAGATPSENGHLPDTFKKPNHPTFSDQSQYAGAPGARPGHWEGDTFVPPEAKTPPNASQEAVSGPSYKHTFKVDGVSFTVNSGSQDKAEAAQHLATTLKDQPAVLGQAATDQGMYYDFQTGRAREYTGMEKFLIGAGEVTSRTIDGSKELYAKATGNAEAVLNLEQKTDDERALFAHLDDKGIGAEDLGAVFAFAPLMFGPGGILGVTALSGAQAGVSATGTEDTHLGNAIEGAAAGALGVRGGQALSMAGRGTVNTIGGVMSAMGVAGVARTATAAVLDVMGAGGMGTGLNLLLKAGQVLRKATKVQGMRGTAEWDRSGGTDLSAQLPGAKASNWLGTALAVFKSDAGKALTKVALGAKGDTAEVIAAREAQAAHAATAPAPAPLPQYTPPALKPAKTVADLQANKAATTAAKRAHTYATKKIQKQNDAAAAAHATGAADASRIVAEATEKQAAARAAVNALVAKLTTALVVPAEASARRDYVRK